MSPDKSLEDLFSEALECRDAVERGRYLDQACGSDMVMRERVEKLIRAHAEAAGFMSDPSRKAGGFDLKETVRINPVQTEKAGDRIGRYKLLQQIGEGGCGVVYMAEQEEPVRRRVALKVIKVGMDTKQVIARFEAERQALALMEHSNIAKVLDAGTTEAGRPYFVMELIRGLKITEFCDENKLSTEERLKLFVQVCQAIQHAHQKGVIHRDIKPSNVLVTLNDGLAVPKVIDFGIAKATAGRLTDQTLFTAFEQFIGTPAYMSPEQAAMTSLDIDTRSDIYSLGVLLYELLTGRPPFDQKELLAAGLDEMRRTIREKEPPKPSTRLSTLASDELTTAAQRRRTEAPKLVHLMRGDLDWIVMKCLEKDRMRRYETANGLAVDVQCYLDDEPISARPPSKLYRLQKLVRRNKSISVAVAVTTMALLAGIVVSTTQAVRANWAEKMAKQERDGATRAQRQAQALNKFLQEDILFQGTPASDAPESIQVLMRQTLERAAKKLDQPEIVRQPETEATLRLAVGESYRWLSEVQLAEANMRRAVILRRGSMGTNACETLLAQKALVCLLSFDTSPWNEEIEKLSFETWQGLKQLAEAKPREPSDKELWRATLDTEAAYIWELAKRGEREKAVELKKENVAACERVLGPDDADSIKALQDYGVALESCGRHAEAEVAYRKAIEGYTRIGQGDTYPCLQSKNNLGYCRFMQGDQAGAESVLKEARARATVAFSAEHALKLDIQHRLARVLAQKGQWDEAEALARETLAARQRTLPLNDGRTAYTMLVLGRILFERGQLEKAQSLLEEAQTIFVGYYAGQPRLAAAAENWLGAISLARKDYVQAERLLLRLSGEFLLPTIQMSPQEQRACLGHIVSLYQALDKPDQVTAWQQKLDAVGKSPTKGR